MVPKHESIAKDIVKICLIVVLVLGIFASIISGEFFFTELSLSGKICFFTSIGFSLKTRGYIRKPSPMELWFYDDFLIHYRPRRYYDKRNIRQEYHKFYYKDIHKFEYRKSLKKFNIYGVYKGIYTKYNKAGVLNTSPSYHRTVDSICQFYTVFEPNIDFIKEIESHSPIKVEISEN